MSAVSSSVATVGRAVILVASIGLAGYLVVSAQRRAEPVDPPVDAPAEASTDAPVMLPTSKSFGPDLPTPGEAPPGVDAATDPTFLLGSKSGVLNEDVTPPPVFLPSSKSRAVHPEYLFSSKTLGPAVDPLKATAPAKPVKP